MSMIASLAPKQAALKRVSNKLLAEPVFNAAVRAKPAADPEQALSGQAEFSAIRCAAQFQYAQALQQGRAGEHHQDLRLGLGTDGRAPFRLFDIVQ